MLCSAISDEFTVNLTGHLVLFTATPDPGIFLYWNVEKNDLDFTHAPPNASLITYQGLQMTVWQVLRLQRVTYVRRSHYFFVGRWPCPLMTIPGNMDLPFFQYIKDPIQFWSLEGRIRSMISILNV